MQIARDSGRITDTYATETACPWCKVGKLRYNLEFQVMTIENGRAVESTEIIKDVCAHCLTVCNEPPRMDFLCAKCGQLSLSDETDGSEWSLFMKAFSVDGGFEEFYHRLLEGGVHEGKRYCMHCLGSLWRDYMENPDSLQKGLQAPKPHFALKS